MGLFRELKYRLFKTYYKEKYLDPKFLMTKEDKKYLDQDFLKPKIKEKKITKKETFTPREIFIPRINTLALEPLYLKFYKTILEFNKNSNQLLQRFNLKIASLNFLFKENRKWSRYKMFMFSSPITEIKFFENKILFIRKNLSTKNILKLTEKRLNSIIFYKLRAKYSFYHINKLYLEKGTFKVIPKIIYINLNKQISFGLLLGFICHRPIIKKYTLIKFKSNIITEFIDNILLGLLKVYKYIKMVYILFSKLVCKKCIAKVIIFYRYIKWLNIRTNLIIFYINIYKKLYIKNYIINLKRKRAILYVKIKRVFKVLFYFYIDYIYTFYLLLESNNIKYFIWSKYFTLSNYLYTSLFKFIYTKFLSFLLKILFFTITIYAIYLDVMYINLIWNPNYNYETFALYIFLVIVSTIVLLQKFELKYINLFLLFLSLNLVSNMPAASYQRIGKLFGRGQYQAEIDYTTYLKPIFDIRSKIQHGLIDHTWPYPQTNTENFIFIFILILLLIIAYKNYKKYVPFEKDFLSLNIIVEEDRIPDNLMQKLFFNKSDKYDILRYYLWFEERFLPSSIFDAWKNVYNDTIWTEQVPQIIGEEDFAEIFDFVELTQIELNNKHEKLLKKEKLKERIYQDIGKKYKKKTPKRVILNALDYIEYVPWGILEDTYNEEIEEIYNNWAVYGALCLNFDGKVRVLSKKNKNLFDYYKILTNDWWGTMKKSQEHLIHLFVHKYGNEIKCEEIISTKEFQLHFTKPLYQNIIPNYDTTRNAKLNVSLKKAKNYNYYSKLINKLVFFEDHLSAKYGIHEMNRSIRLSQLKILDIKRKYNLKPVNLPYQDWIALLNNYYPTIFLEYWEDIADETYWDNYFLFNEIQKPWNFFMDILFKKLLEDFIDRTGLNFENKNRGLAFTWSINSHNLFNINNRYRLLKKSTGK